MKNYLYLANYFYVVSPEENNVNVLEFIKITELTLIKLYKNVRIY